MSRTNRITLPENVRTKREPESSDSPSWWSIAKVCKITWDRQIRITWSRVPTRQIVKVLTVQRRVQGAEAVVDVANSLEVKHCTSRVRVETLRRSSKRLSHAGRG